MNTETSTPVALSYEEVSALRSENAWIIDCRTPDEFIQGFIPESVYFSPEDNIYLDESLLLPIENPAIVVCIEGDEEKVISILREKGVQHIAGYLQGGYENWKCNSDESDMIVDIEIDELAIDLPHDNKLELIDVRRPYAFEEGHIQGSTNVPIETLGDPSIIANIHDSHNLYVIGDKSTVSLTAVSLLKRHGYHNIRFVRDGFEIAAASKLLPIVWPKRN